MITGKSGISDPQGCLKSRMNKFIRSFLIITIIYAMLFLKCSLFYYLSTFEENGFLLLIGILFLNPLIYISYLGLEFVIYHFLVVWILDKTKIYRNKYNRLVIALIPSVLNSWGIIYSYSYPICSYKDLWDFLSNPFALTLFITTYLSLTIVKSPRHID